MKKHLLIALIFLFTFSVSFSQIVPLETARQVAKNIYFERANIEQQVPYKEVAFNNEMTISENGQPLYYIYNVSQNRGFVIVSAEKRTMPVLFYTFEGNYSSENQNENFAYWLGLYKKQIEFVRAQNVPKDMNVEKFWDYYTAASVALAKDVDAVSPLLTTNWNQDCYYNGSCPAATFGPCGKVYAGCVADAMAMVMKYHNYPTHGYGTHSYAHTTANGFANNYGTLTANYGATTYNWGSMPNNVTSSNSAVATLIYHCGVSVNMNYDDQGSGAFLSDVPEAMNYHFTYSTQYADRAMYSNDDWALLIKNSLDSLRPVLYGGNDASMGGHAFVCDGYQNSGTYSNMFHFNWGWSGSSNGYVYLSDIAPSSSGYHFNDYQEIVYNAYPKPATVPVAAFSANVTSVLVNGIVVFFNNSTNDPLDYLWSVTPSAGTSYVASSTATSESAKIKFTIPGYYTISLTVTNSAGTDTETKTNYIYVYSTAGVDDDMISKNILIYPCPATDLVTLETGTIPATEINFQIYNVLGDQVADEFNENITDNNRITLDLSNLQKGIYFIKINQGEHSTTKKIVLN